MLKFPEDIKTQSIKELLEKTIDIASPASAASIPAGMSMT